MPTGYDEVGPESHNLSFLLTLLTMLDFEEPGSVKKEDWERGVAALHAPGLSWEVSWQTLLNRFDLDFNGSIDFGEMHGLAPLDPRPARPPTAQQTTPAASGSTYAHHPLRACAPDDAWP